MIEKSVTQLLCLHQTVDAHQELHQTLTVSLSPCFAKTCARLKSALGVALPQPQLIPYTNLVPFMWQIKSVFKKIKTGIRNGQSQYYSDFI